MDESLLEGDVLTRLTDKSLHCVICLCSLTHSCFLFNLTTSIKLHSLYSVNVGISGTANDEMVKLCQERSRPI